MASFLLKLAVSAVLVYLLLRAIDTDALLRHLFAADGLAVGLAIVLLGSLSLLQALRWRLVIRALGGALPLLTLWLTALVGQFFNQTLPSTIGGDGMRIWRAYKAGLTLGAAASGVILDRLAGLFALLLITVVGLPLLFPLMNDAPERWAIPIVIAVGIAGFAAITVLDRLPRALRRWRPVAWASGFSADTRRVFLSPRRLAPILAWSLIMHVVVIVAVFVIARGLGIDVDFIACLVLVPPVVLVSTVPVSIAGWGVREGAMVAAFGLVGVAPDQALALSVLFGLAVMVVGLPGGLIWFVTGRERAGPSPTAAAGAPAGADDRAESQ